MFDRKRPRMKSEFFETKPKSLLGRSDNDKLVPNPHRKTPHGGNPHDHFEFNVEEGSAYVKPPYNSPESLLVWKTIDFEGLTLLGCYTLNHSGRGATHFYTIPERGVNDWHTRELFCYEASIGIYTTREDRWSMSIKADAHYSAEDKNGRKYLKPEYIEQFYECRDELAAIASEHPPFEGNDG